MSRFAPLLRRTGQRLEIPQPARSRVLLELAGDLEDLYDLYLQRGLDEVEAARRVEEKFAVSDDVLIQLTRLHQSALRRWLDRLSEQAQTRWERSILAAVIQFVVVVTGPKLVTITFDRDASGWIWGVAIIGVIALALGLLISRAITRSLQRLGQATRKVAQGDLKEKVDVKTGDEIGDLAQDTNRMIDDLRKIIGQIRDFAGSLTSSSKNLAHVSQELDGNTGKMSGLCGTAVQATGEMNTTMDSIGTTSRD